MQNLQCGQAPFWPVQAAAVPRRSQAGLGDHTSLSDSLHAGVLVGHPDCLLKHGLFAPFGLYAEACLMTIDVASSLGYTKSFALPKASSGSCSTYVRMYSKTFSSLAWA